MNMSVDREIPSKTLWNASLLAYGCESDTVMKDVGLSKYTRLSVHVLLLKCDYSIICTIIYDRYA